MDFIKFVEAMRDPEVYQAVDQDGLEVTVEPLDELKQHLRKPVFYWPYQVE